MSFVFTNVAKNDLADAFDYIAEDSPSAATEFLHRIDRAATLLATGIIEGREVMLLDGSRVYTWSVKPYRIYYRRKDETVEIVRIYHSARKPIER